MKVKCRHIVSLFLAILLLLSCAACGQTQVEQPEDTGDKDQYMTEPVPEGKPNPVEPQDTTVDTTICTPMRKDRMVSRESFQNRQRSSGRSTRSTSAATALI